MPPYITPPRPAAPVRAHRLLTFAGAALLAVTLLVYSDDPGSPLALATGGAMVAALMASFVLFNREAWRGKK